MQSGKDQLNSLTSSFEEIKQSSLTASFESVDKGEDDFVAISGIDSNKDLIHSAPTPRRHEKNSSEHHSIKKAATAGALQKRETKKPKVKIEQLSPRELVIPHIRYFLNDPNLTLISVTRSADYLRSKAQSISDGIIFFTSRHTDGRLVHVFYPARDTNESASTKITDTFDLDHMLQVYYAAVGQKNDGQRHQLFIPVSTHRKLTLVAKKTDRNHWLDLFIDFYPGGDSKAELTDSQKLPLSYYDESYIKTAVTKHLGLTVTSYYLGQQDITDTKKCGLYKLENSKCSYEGKPKDRKFKVTKEMYWANEKAHDEWVAKNQDNELDENTGIQIQPIPYMPNHKYVAPKGVIDQTVSLSDFTLVIDKNASLQMMSGKDNLHTEFGRGGMKIEELVSVMGSNWDWDYVKLHIDEVTTDPDLQNWIRTQAHMNGVVGDLIQKAQKLFPENETTAYSFFLQTEGRQEETFNLYRDKNADNVIYLSAHIPFRQIYHLDKTTLNAIKIYGKEIDAVAALKMLIKVTKTNDALEAVLEFSHLTTHDKDLFKIFQQIAEEKREVSLIQPPIITTNRNGSEAKEALELSVQHMEERLRALIDTLPIEKEQAKKLREKPYTKENMTEIMLLWQEQKKSAKKSEVIELTPAREEHTEFGMTPELLLKADREGKELEEKIKRQQVVLEKLEKLKGLDEETIRKYTKDLLAHENEIDEALNTQKQVLANLCLLKGLDEDYSNQLEAQPIKYASKISALVKKQEEYLDKANLLQGVVPDSDLNEFLAKPLAQPEKFFSTASTILVEKIKQLAINKDLKSLFISNPWQFIEEIKTLEMQQNELIKTIELINLLDDVDENTKIEYLKNPMACRKEINRLYKEQEIKRAYANELSLFLEMRIDRLHEYVLVCPDKKQSGFSLFGSYPSEKQLAKEHLTMFISLKTPIATKLKNKVKSAAVLNAETIQTILVDVLTDIILTAKYNLLDLRKKGGNLTIDSYAMLLMQYIEELESDLKEFSTKSSIHPLISDGRRLPKLSEALTNEKVANNFRYIETEVKAEISKKDAHIVRLN